MADRRFKMIEKRREKGLTQTQLGLAVGISKRHIIFIEAGQRDPALKLAHKIAEALGSTIDELFFPPSA